MKNWIWVVGGSVAALAATLHFVNAPAPVDPGGNKSIGIASVAERAAPALPQRARLVRLEDRPAPPAEPQQSISPNGLAGLLALLGLTTLWVASRRRLRIETV